MVWQTMGKQDTTMGWGECACDVEKKKMDDTWRINYHTGLLSIINILFVTPALYILIPSTGRLRTAG